MARTHSRRQNSSRAAFWNLLMPISAPPMTAASLTEPPGDSTPNSADIRAVPIHEVRRIDLVGRIVRDDVPAIASELVGWCICPIWRGTVFEDAVGIAP